MANYMWGDQETQHFDQLDPHRILDAVDAVGFRTTGRCLPLNALENRVFEVEVEISREAEETGKNEGRFQVVKFYRPGRWSARQIEEEHQFLQELKDEGVAVITPVSYQGKTLHYLPQMNIPYAVFAKGRGRLQPELTDEQLDALGVVLANVHRVGKKKKSEGRLQLTPESYGLQNLQCLLEQKIIPDACEKLFAERVEELCRLIAPSFQGLDLQRIHGDCHLGNILWQGDDPLLLDFDDMLMGPPVQDIWTIIPGSDIDSIQQRDILIESYETILPFDRRSLDLIGPLRGLRLVHFSAWVMKRWGDMAFQRAFPHFIHENFWWEQIKELEEILLSLRRYD